MELLLAANLLLTLLVLAVLVCPRIARRAKSERPVASTTSSESGLIPEALPAGCQWPEKFDEFDGVMERFVCRVHGDSFLRRRV